MLNKKRNFFFIEDKNFLKKENKFIEQYITQNDYFPYYLQQKTTLNKNNKWNTDKLMCHTIIKRIEHRTEKDYEFNSPLGKYFLNLTKEFCKKHNILFNKILRCSINLSIKNVRKKCNTHVDHDFPHYQIIMFLNKVKDLNSSLILLDKNEKKIIKKIKPDYLKTVCFEDVPHYHYYPNKDVRIVAITTFN
jgi:hypothetical protein